MTVKNDKLTKYVGKTFEELLKDKMERKGMIAEQAMFLTIMTLEQYS